MKRLLCSVFLFALCLPTLAQTAAQPASDAKADTLPIHLGIVLLASKTTFNQQQAAATDLVQTLIKNSGDEAFVITAGGEKGWPYPRLDWDTKADSLAKFIKGLDKNTGMPDAFGYRIDMSSGTDFRGWFSEFRGSDPEASAFGIAVAMMNSDPRPARRIVILFRDPWEHCKGWSSMGTTGEWARAIDQRHDKVVSMFKQAGVTAYIIGIDDPALKPQMPSELASSYNTLHGDAGEARVLDQEFRKRLDTMTVDGHTNVERIAKGTGGVVIYSTKKNYSDAVAKLTTTVSSSGSAGAVGK